MTEQAINDWLRRTHDAARHLQDHAADLAAYVTPGSAPADPTGIRGTKVHAQLPFRADVLDLVNEVAEQEIRQRGAVRDALRLNEPRAYEVPWLWIAEHLYPLYDHDAELTAAIVAVIWDLHFKAARIVEPWMVREPRRIDDLCPVCEFPSLWVNPSGLVATWRIACGMPFCRAEWTAHEPLLRGR